MHRRMLVHFLKPSQSHVHFGEAYEPDTSKSYDEIMEELRKRMVALAMKAEGKPPEETDVPHGSQVAPATGEKAQ